MAKWVMNMAIKIEEELKREYDKGNIRLEDKKCFTEFKLLYKVGLLHSIPESKFDISRATIMDLYYLGLDPKGVVKEMLKFKQKIKKKGDNILLQAFQQGKRQLLASIILRTISTQKVISFLLKNEVNQIQKLCSGSLEETSSNKEGNSHMDQNCKETTEEYMDVEQEGKIKELEWDNLDPEDKCTHVRCKLLVICNALHEMEGKLKHQWICNSCKIFQCKRK